MSKNNVGDCTAELSSASSCTNTGGPGYTCTASTCVDGTLIEGLCGCTFALPHLHFFVVVPLLMKTGDTFLPGVEGRGYISVVFCGL